MVTSTKLMQTSQPGSAALRRQHLRFPGPASGLRWRWNRASVFTMFFFFLVSFPSPSAAADLFYVSPNGSDSNSGLTLDQPWRTIQKAFRSATAGSTVFIRGGTYREWLTLEVSGSGPEGYITFRPYASESVVLDATGIDVAPLVLIHDKRYVIIRGIHFTNYRRDLGIGIWIFGGSERIEFRNNVISNFRLATYTTPYVIDHEITHGMTPIQIDGEDPNRPTNGIVIDGNEIYNCAEGWSETIGVTTNSINWEITNNRLHHNDKSLTIAGHFSETLVEPFSQARNGVIRGNTISDAQTLWGNGIYISGARDIVVEHNTAMRNTYGIVVSCEHPGKTASGIIVRNNLLYDNLSNGITMGGWDRVTYGTVVDSKVLNNTVVNNPSGILVMYASGIDVQNNIVSAETGIANIDGNPDTIRVDYNLYEEPFGTHWKGTEIYGRFSDYQSLSGQDSHSLLADPRFVSRTSKDFHLAGGSPAINRGNPAFRAAPGEQDFDGQSRVISNRVDIGMDEYSPSTVRGDLNLDGACDVLDAVILANYLVGNLGPGSTPFSAALSEADLNRDGVVSVVDLALLRVFLVGILSSLPG